MSDAVVLNFAIQSQGIEEYNDAILSTVRSANLTLETLQGLDSVITLGSAAEGVEGAERLTLGFAVLARDAAEAAESFAAFQARIGATGADAGNLSNEFGRLGWVLDKTADVASASISASAAIIVSSFGAIKGGAKALRESFTVFGGVATHAFDITTASVIDFATSISTIGQTLDSLASGGLFQLDQQAARLTGQLNKGSISGDEFKGTVLDLAAEAGVATSVVGDLGYQLIASGQAFDKSSESALTMAEMVGALGMPIEEVAQFNKQAELMGTSLKDLMDDAAEFSKATGIADTMQELPGITNAVIKTQAQFGNATVSASRTTTNAVVKMAGIYSKALGKTMAEAAKDAQETFAAFAGETQSFKDVFLGLADGFSPLQTAFLEAGMGIDNLGNLMQQAQTDPSGFVDQVERIRNSLDPHMAERFFQNVLRNAPESVKMLLTQQEALRNATDEQRAQLEKAAEEREVAQEKQEAFNKVLGNMRDNVVDAYDVFNNLLVAFKTTIGLKFAKNLKEGFQEAGKAVGVLLGKLGLVLAAPDGTRWEKFKSVLKEYSPTLSGIVDWFGKLSEKFKWVLDTAQPLFKWLGLGEVSLGKFAAVAIGMTTAVGAITSVLGPFGIMIQPIAKLVFGLGKTFFSLFTGITEAGGVLGGFGFVLKRIALPLGIAYSLFEGFSGHIEAIGTAIKNQEWETLLDELLGGLWDSFDTFFLGLPGKISEGFSGKEIDTTGAESLGETIGGWFATALEVVVPWTLKLIDRIVDTLDSPEGQEKLKKGFKAVALQIGSFVEGLAKGFMEHFELPVEAWGVTLKGVILEVSKYQLKLQLAVLNKVLFATAEYTAKIIDFLSGGETNLEEGVEKLRDKLTDKIAGDIFDKRIKENQAELLAIAGKHGAESALTPEAVRTQKELELRGFVKTETANIDEAKHRIRLLNDEETRLKTMIRIGGLSSEMRKEALAELEDINREREEEFRLHDKAVDNLRKASAILEEFTKRQVKEEPKASAQSEEKDVKPAAPKTVASPADAASEQQAHVDAANEKMSQQIKEKSQRARELVAESGLDETQQRLVLGHLQKIIRTGAGTEGGPKEGTDLAKMIAEAFGRISFSPKAGTATADYFRKALELLEIEATTK